MLSWYLSSLCVQHFDIIVLFRWRLLFAMVNAALSLLLPPSLPPCLSSSSSSFCCHHKQGERRQPPHQRHDDNDENDELHRRHHNHCLLHLHHRHVSSKEGRAATASEAQVPSPRPGLRDPIQPGSIRSPPASRCNFASSWFAPTIPRIGGNVHKTRKHGRPSQRYGHRELAYLACHTVATRIIVS